MMRGIILAAGRGTRLRPLTDSISKSLIPICNKPMIHYPLSSLVLAGIKEILIITNEEDQDSFMKVLGNGSKFGINLTYAVQYESKGIADALIIGEEFISKNKVCLILGDNIFCSDDIGEIIIKASECDNEATVFLYEVDKPQEFGVAEVDEKGKIISLEEKPLHPKSNYAVVGLYLYESSACELARELKPSARGELEITDLNRVYMERGSLHSVRMKGKNIWVDAGTFDSLDIARQIIKDAEMRKK